MIYHVFEIWTSFVEVIILYLSMNLIFNRNVHKIKILMLSLVWTGIILHRNSIQLFSFVSIFLFSAYGGVTAALIYKTKLKYTISFTLFYTLVTFVIDFVVASLLSLMVSDPKYLSTVFYEIGTRRLLYITIAKVAHIGLYFILKKYMKEMEIDGYKFMVFITFCGFSGGLFLSKLTFDYININVAVSWVFLVVIIGLLFMVYSNYMNYKYKKEQLEFVTMRNELLEKNYSDLKSVYESNSKLTHDFKHHIKVIQQLVSEGNISELNDYMNGFKLNDDMSDKMKWTEDTVVNFIINNKMSEGRRDGIYFSVNVDFPLHTNINSNDMTTMLANLLDNAIESCNKIPEDLDKSIDLVIRRINSMLLIKVENSCHQKPKNINNHYPTSKEDGKRHGWGLLSINNTAKKYDGTVECSFDEERRMFKTVISLSFKELVEEHKLNMVSKNMIVLK